MPADWVPDRVLPDALSMALDDEYRARATYAAVLARHGPVRPFSQIVDAEQRHIEALLPLFARYGIAPPPDRWFGRVAAHTTLQQACAAGVSGEVRNYQMYDHLLGQVAEPDVRNVFIHLRNASAYQHLPAFAHCVGNRVTAASPTDTVDARTLPLWLSLWLGIAAGAGLAWWIGRRGQEA